MNPIPPETERYHPENEQSFDTCLSVPNYMYKVGKSLNNSATHSRFHILHAQHVQVCVSLYVGLSLSVKPLVTLKNPIKIFTVPVLSAT